MSCQVISKSCLDVGQQERDQDGIQVLALDHTEWEILGEGTRECGIFLLRNAQNRVGEKEACCGALEH